MEKNVNREKGGEGRAVGADMDMESQRNPREGGSGPEPRTPGPLPLTSRKLGDEWELSFWDHGNNLIMGGQRDRKRGEEGRKYSCRYL